MPSGGASEALCPDEVLRVCRDELGRSSGLAGAGLDAGDGAGGLELLEPVMKVRELQLESFREFAGGECSPECLRLRERLVEMCPTAEQLERLPVDRGEAHVARLQDEQHRLVHVLVQMREDDEAVFVVED